MVVVGAGGEVVVGVELGVVVVVVVLLVGVTTVVVVVVGSIAGAMLVAVDESATAVVVVAASSAAVPALGMAGTSVTWPRTDPTADAAIIVATMVAATQATKTPTRRVMPILCPRRPVTWITVR